MLSVKLTQTSMFLWKYMKRMGGAIVLPTWMSHLDDWNEALMDRLGMFLWIVKITHFKKPLERIIEYQHSFLLHISKLFSLFNVTVILSQTNRQKYAFTDMDVIALPSVSKVNKSIARTKIKQNKMDAIPLRIDIYVLEWKYIMILRASS